MVKFQVKAVKILKEGENQGGHYVMRAITFTEAVKVFEQNGDEHIFTSGSTFDNMASAVVAGETWEAEAETTPAKEAGKFYLNLKKLNKVGQTPSTTQSNPAHASPTPATPPATSKGQPEKPKPIDIRDRAVCLSYAKDLVVAKIIEPGKMYAAAEQMLQWLAKAELPESERPF